MSFLDSFSSALPKEITLEYLKQFVPVEWWDEKPEWAAVSALCRCGKFDVQDYLKRYPDVEQTDIDPVLHFVRHGIKENRLFNCMPDTDFGGSKVNLAYKAFKNGEYEKALKLYEELGERIGVENFAANIAICKKNINNYKIKDIKIVVTLTSYGKRLETVHTAINSILNQSVIPDKIILYISDNEIKNKNVDIPSNIKDLCKNDIFDIKLCKDLKSYNKIIHALRTYKNSILITIDDDVIYEKNTIEILVKEHKKYPKAVIAHRCHRILFDDNLDFKNYKNWKMRYAEYSSSYRNLQTGVGAVLYPPKCFYKDVLNDNIFLHIAPKADDLWLWSMLVLNKTKIIIPKLCNNKLKYIEGTQEASDDFKPLFHDNVNGEKNDKQLKEIIKKYPEIKNIIFEDELHDNNIVFISDSNYLDNLCVAIESIMDSKFHNTKYNITIIFNNVKDKSIIKKMNDKYSVNIDFLDINIDEIKSIHKEGNQYCTANSSAIIKFMIPELLKNKKRVLYLDCDIVVKRDLKDFININMQNKTIAAVRDTGILYSDKFLRYSKKYFNSGVLIIDMEKFRLNNYTKKLIGEKENLKDNSLVDQNVFNMIFKDDYHELPIKFNFLYTNLVRAKNKYELKDLNSMFNTSYNSLDHILSDSSIIHFASKDKPWIYDNVPFSKEYYNIYKKSILKHKELNRKKSIDWR